MSEALLETIKILIIEKQNKIDELCHHKNRNLAEERCRELREDINNLRKMASGKL